MLEVPVETKKKPPLFHGITWLTTAILSNNGIFQCVSAGRLYDEMYKDPLGDMFGDEHDLEGLSQLLLYHLLSGMYAVPDLHRLYCMATVLQYAVVNCKLFQN
jgi:hypothetical protein